MEVNPYDCNKKDMDVGSIELFSACALFIYIYEK